MNDEELIKEFSEGRSVHFDRECDQLGLRSCNIQVDDPGWDGTGYEHPAFYRGEQYGASQVLRRIKEVLSGKDEGHGRIGDPELEAVRREIMALRDRSW